METEIKCFIISELGIHSMAIILIKWTGKFLFEKQLHSNKWSIQTEIRAGLSARQSEVSRLGAPKNQREISDGIGFQNLETFNKMNYSKIQTFDLIDRLDR